MSSIDSTQLRERLNYNPETGIFTWKDSFHKPKIGRVAGTKIRGYIAIAIGKQVFRAHRLAWMYVYGCFPTLSIDHINGNRSDNRICNLREATTSENMQNRYYSTGKSKLLGITFDKGKWNSKITINNRYVHLGRFSTPEEAHQAYVTAKRELHPFGNL